MTSPIVILVRPQMGENIGAAARAMMNFGLTRMRLVAPRDGWPNERAEAMSSGALEKMPPVEVFDTLEDAVADCHYIAATTARLREVNKPVLTPAQLAQECEKREGQTIALLFGAERSGLSNDEVARAHSIINIPANPDFSSLNLGQAVLLVGYELFKKPPAPETNELNSPAKGHETENFFLRLENELETHHFYRVPEMKPTIVRNMRSLFLRAEPTSQEISTLHGIITALIGGKKP